MFLHVDFMHITFNLLSQLIIGGFIERIFGFWRTFGIYVISGVGGTLLGCLINDKISVGASGAIFGLCSALVLLCSEVDWVADSQLESSRPQQSKRIPPLHGHHDRRHKRHYRLDRILAS